MNERRLHQLELRVLALLDDELSPGSADSSESDPTRRASLDGSKSTLEGASSTVVDALARLSMPLASRVGATLDAAGQPYVPCKDVDELCEQAVVGAAGLILSEALIDESALRRIETLLNNGDSWSDLPVLVITPDPDTPRATLVAERIEQCVFLSAPVETGALMRAVRQMVRSRSRQYEMRAYLEVAQHARAALSDAKERLELTFEATGGMHYQLDRRTGRVERSAGLFDLLGVHPEDAEPTTIWWRSRVHPDDVHVLNPYFGEMDEGTAAAPLRYRILHSDGSYISVVDQIVMAGEGELTRLVGNVTRAHPAEMLAQLELQQAVDAGNMGVWSWDASDYRLKGSERTFEMFGVPRDGFDGRVESFIGKIHPSDTPRVRRLIDAMRRDRKPIEVEFRVTPRAGVTRWVNCGGRPVLGAGGAVTRVLGLVYDVTDRRRVEEELAARADQQSAVAALGQMALAGADLKSLMNAATAGVARTLGTGFAAVMEFRPDRNAFLLISAVGWPADSPGYLWVSTEETQAGYTLATGGPVVIDDVSEETRFRSHPLVLQHKIVSGLSVIIPGRTVPFGLISAHTTSRRAFSVDDVNFLKSVANVVAAAVESGETRRALGESKDQLQVAVRGAALGTFNYEPPTGRLIWNDTCKAHFGLHANDELTLDRFFSLLHPDDREPTDQAMRRSLDSREQFDVEYRVILPDGKPRWLRAIGAAIYDAAGAAVRFDGMTIDITSRKLADEAQRVSQQRLRLALEAGKLGSWTVDPSARTMECDAQCKINCGISPAAELTWDAFHNRIHPDDAPAVDERIREAVETIGDYQIEYRLLWPDGSTHWLAVSGRAERSADRGSIFMSGVCADITERKLSEQALREIDERYRIISRATNDVIWEWDLVAGRLHWNAAFAGVFGHDPSAFGSLSDWRSLIHPEDFAVVSGGMRRVIDGADHLWAEEYRFRKSDGTYAVVFDRAYVHRNEAGEPLRMIGSMIDLTERKRAETELKKLNETLEERVAERTAVAEDRTTQLRELALALTQTEQRERRRLAQVLHDHLQQLLVAAKLRVGLLRPDRPPEEIFAAMKKLDDLLEQSIAASRSLTVELSPPVLYDRGFIAGLSWLAKRMAEEHGLTVEVIAGPDIDPPVDEIGALLFQATRELLFNIVKHAGVNTATVSATRYGERLTITVEDAGSGFDMSARVSDRGDAGGFGLFSIRERIGLFGGTFTIESEPRKGTCVTLTIPLRAAPAPMELAIAVAPVVQPSRPAIEGVGDRRIRVLLADDHKILREGLAGLLREQPDIEVIGEAIDGQMVVDLARELEPDVVIMDITMPKLNGIEATRRILAHTPSARVIGLSMHEIDSMASAIRAAGAVAYLTKGGPVGDLVAAIRSHAPVVDKR